MTMQLLSITRLFELFEKVDDELSIIDCFWLSVGLSIFELTKWNFETEPIIVMAQPYQMKLNQWL